jgi:hypothetical protein
MREPTQQAAAVGDREDLKGGFAGTSRKQRVWISRMIDAEPVVGLGTFSPPFGGPP